MSSWGRYIKWFGGAVALFLALSLALNVVVNPLRLFPSPLSIDGLDEYREISGRMRTGKAGLIRSESDWDVCVFGSSRVGHGFDPLDGVWGGKKTVNLGMSGGFLTETIPMIHYALYRIKPRCVVIRVDPGDLTSDHDGRQGSDFYLSPLAGEVSQLNRELSYVFGVKTTELSFKALRNSAQSKPAKYTPQGLSIEYKRKRKKSQLEFIQSQFTPDSKALFEQNGIRASKRDSLGESLKVARADGRRVVVIYLPMHALYDAQTSHLGFHKAPIEHERRVLLEITEAAGAELWDFHTYSSAAQEPLVAGVGNTMKSWKDLGHFTSDMGTIMLEQIMGVGDERGQILGGRHLPERMDQHLQQVAQQYQHYLQTQGMRDVQMKEERQKKPF